MGFTDSHQHILEQTLSLMTAPFNEKRVISFIEDFAKNQGAIIEKDVYGNLIIQYKHGPCVPPIGIVAHMDHPGFEVLSFDDDWVIFQNLGGVAPPKEGDSLLCVGKQNLIVEITKVTALPKRTFQVQIPRSKIENPHDIEFAVYNLDPCVFRDNKVYSHAIDDLAGCAAMLSVMEFLFREKYNAHVYFIFTRAEEVGFVGASGIAMGNYIPKTLPLISLEASKWLPGAEQDKGVIVRIGDKANVFESNLSKFLLESAISLKKNHNFCFQSRIMDGGSCEASLFTVLGYSASGLALPLDCYHNIGPNNTITEENIALNDWKGMVDLLCYIATNTEKITGYKELCMVRYLEKFRQYREKLKSSAL